MLLRSSSLLALLIMTVGLAAHAENKRVQKRGAGGIRYVFWVDSQFARSDGRVHITAIPPRLSVGDSFEIVDIYGRWGRVTVEEFEDGPFGCHEYRRGVARLADPPKRDLVGPAVALGPSPAGRLERAAVLTLDKVKEPAPQQRPEAQDKTYVDIDGDGEADLFRQFYRCGRNGNGWCFEWFSRSRSKWHQLEQVHLEACN